MAEDRRCLVRYQTALYFPIRVTYPGRLHLHENFSRPRLGYIDILHNEARARFMENCGLHISRCLPPIARRRSTRTRWPTPEE